jgi:hypothetical protein
VPTGGVFGQVLQPVCAEYQLDHRRGAAGRRQAAPDRVFRLIRRPFCVQAQPAQQRYTLTGPHRGGHARVGVGGLADALGHADRERRIDPEAGKVHLELDMQDERRFSEQQEHVPVLARSRLAPACPLSRRVVGETSPGQSA